MGNHMEDSLLGSSPLGNDLVGLSKIKSLTGLSSDSLFPGTQLYKGDSHGGDESG